MRLTTLRIHWKIIILSLGITLFSLLIGGIVLMGTLFRLKESETGQRLLLTARTVAELPAVRSGMNATDRVAVIDPIAERIRIINGATYLVVLDMNKIRISHPNGSMIGLAIDDKDAEPAFAEHTYTSKVRGELGTAVRAYVPVIDGQYRQVGVVMAGQLLPTWRDIMRSQRSYIGVTSLMSLLFGIWGSWMLAGHIKKQMYDLEPHEIARMFRERTAAFHAMHEGVIAIDNALRITILNDRAKRIFGIEGDVLGKPILEILPDSRLPEIVSSNRPVYNQELQIGRALIWSNRIPIREGEQTIGALAIFQDRTEVAHMAEELTGVRTFVDALRVQNHEHMNKMHTIAGLLQLGQTSKALDYLFELSERQEHETRFLTNRIQDEGISGLLMGKISRGRELGIDVRVDERSRLDRFPKPLDRHDFVVILGNLIENAFDALAGAGMPHREVYISLEQDEEMLELLVEDNGPGMDEETKERMLERGFSTKAAAGRGIGLYLVSQIVRKGQGTLTCESAPGSGTSFILTFPMAQI